MNEKEFNTEWQLTRSRKDQEGETKLANKAGTVEAGTRWWGNLWWLVLAQAGDTQRPEACALFFAACGIVL